MSEQGRYGFGRNWSEFVRSHFDEARVEAAMESLTAFTKLPSFEGRSFLDIGNGSGLFSLAAHRLGARPIRSFDYDADSVACARALHEREGSPAHWQIEQGSVLDREYMASLGPFDLVYSWGVLHHTGSMWEAIRNASQRVAPGGLLYIAIYNSADSIGIHSDGRIGTAKFWEQEKKLYCALPRFGQRIIDGAAASGMIASYLVRGQNPVKQIRGHRSLRGMAWMVDIRDWLGGLPFEHARADEIFRFVHDECGLELENLTATNSLMNNEFLFRRREA